MARNFNPSLTSSTLPKRSAPVCIALGALAVLTVTAGCGQHPDTLKAARGRETTTVAHDVPSASTPVSTAPQQPASQQPVSREPGDFIATENGNAVAVNVTPPVSTASVEASPLYVSQVDPASLDTPPARARDVVDVMELPPGLCDAAILASDFELGAPPQHVLYVSADAPLENADGSEKAPFPTLSLALEAASEPTQIHVAVGEYAETVTVHQAPVWLMGGFDPETWKPAAVGSSSVVTVTVSGDQGAPTLLDSLQVNGGVYIRSGAQVVARRLEVHKSYQPETLESLAAPISDGAVKVQDSHLRLENSSLTIDGEPRFDLIAPGVRIDGGCARIVDNYVSGFSTPFNISDSEGTVLAYNSVERGNNGAMLAASNTWLLGNYMQLVEPPSGCTYAVYMSREAQTRIAGNHFEMNGDNLRGINEACVACDPAELRDNVFHTRFGASVLYLDRSLEHPAEDALTLIADIATVNTLPDVLTLSGNTQLAE